mmetsp:Transcript_18049/g.13084  ORF Transcript_18049/g.13084 Transcript_18049/m.13084 type:complete len:110 (-) Transcript_18049:584-913(-)
MNNQLDSTTAETTITLIPDVITQMSNYSSSYTSVSASSAFTIVPAFLYPECPDFTGNQPIPASAQITYFLFNSNNQVLLQMDNPPTIPAGTMASSSSYYIKFTYSPNAY